MLYLLQALLLRCERLALERANAQTGAGAHKKIKLLSALSYMCPHTTTIILLYVSYMCPHATIYTTIHVSSDAERLKYKAAELATKLEAARAQLAARCDRRDDMLLQARAAWERQLEEVGF